MHQLNRVKKKKSSSTPHSSAAFCAAGFGSDICDKQAYSEASVWALTSIDMLAEEGGGDLESSEQLSEVGETERESETGSYRNCK